MVNWGTITLAIIITSIYSFFSITYASELSNSYKSKEFLVMQTKQYDKHKNYTAMPHKSSPCHYKKESYKKNSHKKSHKLRKVKSYAHMVAMHADKLNLSDNQLGRLIRLHKKHSNEYKKIKKKIYRNLKILNYSGMSFGADELFLRTLGDEHLNIFKSLLDQHIRNRKVINTILTDEQKNQLKKMKIDSDKHSCQYNSA
tara:strand:- start:3407 stop:4006 length:600 start_codon:yes stop_codon:yes gene_type:complete